MSVGRINRWIGEAATNLWWKWSRVLRWSSQFSLHLGSSSNSWLWALDSAQRSKTFRDRVSSFYIMEELGVEQLLFSADSSPSRLFRNQIRMPSPLYCGGIQETLEQTQKAMERLHVPSGLGASWDSLWGAGGLRWGKSCVGIYGLINFCGAIMNEQICDHLVRCWTGQLGNYDVHWTSNAVWTYMTRLH